MTENPDAESVMPCEAAKAAIVVYGKRLGRKLTVCTDKHCPVRDPQAAAEAAAHPIPAMAPAPEAETEEEATERQAEHNRRAEIIKGRQATFERILENTPATLSHAQLRVLLRAIVNLDPYTFADDLAEDITELQTATNVARIGVAIPSSVK